MGGRRAPPPIVVRWRLAPAGARHGPRCRDFDCPVLRSAIEEYGWRMDVNNLLQAIVWGISNGAVFALIALGYTLVYGIIELINFAHGDVFMLGSFVSASFFGTIGLAQGQSAVALFFGLLLTLL